MTFSLTAACQIESPVTVRDLGRVDQPRRQILTEAMALADERGLAALSMRAVAERLGLSSMALYPYVGSKDGLLNGLVELFIIDLLPTATSVDGDWRARIRGMARALRAHAHAHPAVYALFMQRPSNAPGVARLRERIYAALLEAGVPEARVPRLERMLSTFVLGFVAAELDGRFANRHPDRLPPEERDTLAAHARLAPWLAAPVDWDAEFDANLDDVIHLIERGVAGA